MDRFIEEVLCTLDSLIYFDKQTVEEIEKGVMKNPLRTILLPTNFYKGNWKNSKNIAKYATIASAIVTSIAEAGGPLSFGSKGKTMTWVMDKFHVGPAVAAAAIDGATAGELSTILCIFDPSKNWFDEWFKWT